MVIKLVIPAGVNALGIDMRVLRATSEFKEREVPPGPYTADVEKRNGVDLIVVGTKGVEVGCSQRGWTNQGATVTMEGGD